jgi:prefoldin subunit 5
LERQNAVLQQELEFTKAELKELKEKYSELAKTKETVLEVSQPAPTINIDEILENHRL